MKTLLASLLLAVLLALLGSGCAQTGKLSFVDPIAPVVPADIAKAQDSSRVAAGIPPGRGDEEDEEHERHERERTPDSRPAIPLRAMFADTLVGFQPNTADSPRRYLGRLRDGYTDDTLNLVVMGEKDPDFKDPAAEAAFIGERLGATVVMVPGTGHYPHAQIRVSRTADDCPSRPHPAMLTECCDETGFAPARTIVIGDAIYDMQMAKAAGARAVGGLSQWRR